MLLKRDSPIALMHREKRGQVSLEYLVILGMALAVLIPATYLFYDYSQSTNERVVRGQIDVIGAKVITQAKAMYALGRNNRVTLDLTIPAPVTNITVLDGIELVMTYKSRQGVQDAVYFSDVNITGAYQMDNSPCPDYCTDSKWTVKPIASGAISLRIESKGDYVVLNQSN